MAEFIKSFDSLLAEKQIYTKSIVVISFSTNLYIKLS
jgi:hypothetical protein